MDNYNPHTERLGGNIFDAFFGRIQRYRRWRGGRWYRGYSGTWWKIIPFCDRTEDYTK